MTENEYVNLSNKVKIRSALSVLRDVVFLNEDEELKDKFHKATAILHQVADELVKRIKIKGEE